MKLRKVMLLWIAITATYLLDVRAVLFLPFTVLGINPIFLTAVYFGSVGDLLTFAFLGSKIMRFFFGVS